jgi:hypothetical protein
MTTLRRISLVIAMTVVCIAAGCRSESAADTPKFPDMSDWSPVAVADYDVDLTTPGHSNTGTYFKTPDGVVCKIGGYPPGAGCSGHNLPGLPPVTDGSGVNTIDTLTGIGDTNSPGSQDGKVHGNPVKTLPPFHTITVEGTTCGVDDAGTTACRDEQGNAFVLSPSGSGFLPKE